MSINKNTFCHRLKVARVDAGLTQAELGALIDRCNSAVCSWEKGARTPSTKHVGRIAKVLNVSPAWLLYGIPEVAEVRQ